MYEVIKRADEFGLNKVFANSREFVQVIEELSSKKDETQISELVKEVLNKSGYTKALELEDTTQAENRLENLEEFLTVAIEFEEETAESTLAEFLESITLSSDVDELEETEEAVTLMTLHSAKGLEFPVVFLVGMEDRNISKLQINRRTKRIRRRKKTLLCWINKSRGISIFNVCKTKNNFWFNIL